MSPGKPNIAAFAVLFLLLSFIGKTYAEVPGWAAVFNQNEYDHFVFLVEDYFAQHDQKIRIEDGAAIPLAPDKQGDRYGLMNLAQSCAREEPDDWSSIIAQHFDTISRLDDERRELAEKSKDYKQIESLLALRLWPEDYLASLKKTDIVTRQDLDATITIMVYDLPSVVQTVKAEDALAWRRSEKALFRRALENTKKRYPVSLSEATLGNGASVFMLSGEHIFVSSHLLLLHEHPKCSGNKGSLVGVPHRQVVICFAIDDLAVIDTIHAMLPAVYSMYHEGPGSISPHLYWYHDSVFTLLPATVDNEEYNLKPPKDFVEMLNGLVPPVAAELPPDDAASEQ